MNAEEKQIVRQAIQHLLSDHGDFMKAIDRLSHLVGGCYPAYHVRRRAKAVDIRTIAAGKNRRFGG